MPVAAARDLVGAHRGRPGLCHRLRSGSPSAFANAGLDFARLEAVFLTHLHADHVGDLPGMLLYPWGARDGDNGPLAPIRVYGPPRPGALPTGDATFHRTTTVHPELPAPGTTDLVASILAGYAYHLNVMPLDAHMPDAGALVRATDISVPTWTVRHAQVPVVVFDDGVVRVTAVAVPHGRAVRLSPTVSTPRSARLSSPATRP